MKQTAYNTSAAKETGGRKKSRGPSTARCLSWILIAMV
jgi:hypothetical protein